MVFCNLSNPTAKSKFIKVTILILIDGFLQSYKSWKNRIKRNCHNPYFNRWFSAIRKTPFLGSFLRIVTILILIDGFLQLHDDSAYFIIKNVTILILIDGFLQYVLTVLIVKIKMSHNPYFNRWFSAIVFNTAYLYIGDWGHNPYFNRWFSAI